MKTSPFKLIATVSARLPKGLVRFLAVGCSGLCVDLSILWLLERLGLDKAVARAASLGVATVVTWFLNRRVTFEASGRDAREELGRYAAVTLVAQGVNYFVFLGVLAAAPSMVHTLAACIGAVCAAGFSYTGHRFFSFARRKFPAAARGIDA